MMKLACSALLLCHLLTASAVSAQSGGATSGQMPVNLPRLPASILDVSPPSARVEGAPGAMRIIDRSCSVLPLDDGLRQRIVNTAVQEWAFFGFQIDDQRGTAPLPGQPNRPFRFTLLNPAEAARVADSVGGYWAAAPGSDWILDRQNQRWQGPDGLASRYSDPWSAAFISWVMCESGLGEQAKFRRAIAHHTYIDQAIRSRDGSDSDAVYRAYEPGEQRINPGDMLCNGLRPRYRSLAERRAQLGEGARTHCDIVVQVNEDAGVILTIGGNVRSSVRMKIFPAGSGNGGPVAPLPTARTIFAHLQLQSPPIATDAVDRSPTMNSLACTLPDTPATFADARMALVTAGSC